MDVNTTIDIDAVKVVETLGVEDRPGALDTTTHLFGSLPELDWMALLELEQRFGITEEGEDLTADGFDTRAIPAAFVDDKLR